MITKRLSRQNMAAKIAYTAQVALSAKAKKIGIIARPHMVDCVTLAAIKIWQSSNNQRDVYAKIQRDAERVLRSECTASHAINQLI